MRTSSDAATEDCAAGASFLGSGGGACCAEATAEQKITADRTAILFMALLLRETTYSLETRDCYQTIADSYRAGGARGEMAPGTAENPETTRGATSSRFMTGTIEMTGVWVATADPTVEQVGQKCEADEVTVRSAQKWN